MLSYAALMSPYAALRRRDQLRPTAVLRVCVAALLFQMVEAIRLRTTGEAFLLYGPTGEVVASRQLMLSTSQVLTTIPRFASLALPGPTQSRFQDLTDGSGASVAIMDAMLGESGSVRLFEWASPGAPAYEIVWQDVWGGEYKMVTCTRLDEILEPIEDQVCPHTCASPWLLRSLESSCTLLLRPILRPFLTSSGLLWPPLTTLRGSI